MIYKNLPVKIQKKISYLLSQDDFLSAVKIYKEYQRVKSD